MLVVVEIVRFEVVVAGFMENAAEAPGGSPLTLRVTLLPNPLIPVMLTTYAAAAPAVIV